MLKRLRPSVGSAHVIALLALFAALGGGYAVAFSGSGTLQKAAVGNLPTSFTDVRTLKGFGKIQARCETDGNTLELIFFNSASNPWHAFGERTGGGGSDIVNFSLQPGGNSSQEVVGQANSYGRLDLHITKEEPADNKAQIHLSIKGLGPGLDDSCANTRLRILALNTQE